MTDIVHGRLHVLGISLPTVPPPAGNCAVFKREGRLLKLAGAAALRADGTMIVGKVGRELSFEEGREAARLCAIQLLALNQAGGGDLDRVRGLLLMVRGFVNAAEAPRHLSSSEAFRKVLMTKHIGT